jgi:hypothetical protein
MIFPKHTSRSLTAASLQRRLRVLAIAAAGVDYTEVDARDRRALK